MVRRFLRMSVLLSALLTLSPSHVLAQETEFTGVFPDHPSETAGVLIGATRASTAQWPATLVIKYRNPTTNEVGRCTATVIGPRTILTAAHCMKDKARVNINRQGSATFTAECTHHPDYKNNPTLDFSLCLTSTTLSGFRFERINTDASLPLINSLARLLGFGCIMEGGVDGSFGKLYTGQATVIGRPTPQRNYVSTEGGAAVCFGDSGGGAFITVANQTYLFAVISRGDISKISRLSAIASADFLSFLDSWIIVNNPGPVCGRGAPANLCRSGA